MDEEALLHAEGASYVALLSIYGAPFADASGLNLGDEQLAAMSGALDAHYERVLGLAKGKPGRGR